MTTPATDPLDAPTAALAAAVLEVARHLEGEQLPAPRLFALARSAELLASSPALASLLGVEADGDSAPDELQLTPIDLDEGDPADESTAERDPLAVLESAHWPDLAAGGAIVCDLAPAAWSLRDGAEDAHLPEDGSLRVVVAGLSDGTTWSALQRGSENGYVLGPALLPEISEALVQTLAGAD